MRFISRSILLAIKATALLLSLATVVLSAAPEGKMLRLSMDKLVIALKPDKDPDRMLAGKEALQNYLSGKLGCEVKVIVPLNAAIITEGFANGSLDLGYLSSTGVAKANKLGLADVLLAGEINGKTHYLSYWVSLKEKSYVSVEDLKGKPVAFSSRSSTSGFLIPVWDLYQKGHITQTDGPESFFGKGNVYYGVGYVSAVERVLNGMAEAAAVSYYVLDKDRHLSAAQRAKLKMVTSQGPVPTHVIAYRESLAEKDRRLLKAALLQFNEEKPELRDTVFNSRLVEVDQAEHLNNIRKALDIVSNMSY